MSYLVTKNLGGNLHDAAHTINKLGAARNLLQMNFSGSATVAVFRADDYPDYLLLCEKLGTTPVSTKEFFA